MSGGDSLRLERPPFEQVPDALWLQGACSPGAVVAYMALSRRGSRDGSGFPKRSTLAADMGMSSVRGVDLRLNELVQAGWLLITPRWRENADHGQTSNIYTLLWSPITSEDDPRLVEHRRLVAAFDAEMAARHEAKIAAGKAPRDGKTNPRGVRRVTWTPPAKNPAGGGEPNCHAGGEPDCHPGANETAPQEPDFPLPRPSSTQTTASAALRDGDDAATDGGQQVPPADALIPEPPRRKRATPRRTLSAETDAEPSDVEREYAARTVEAAGRAGAVNLGVEWQKFVNYHEGRGTPLASRYAAWRTWVLTACSSDRPGGRGGGGRPAYQAPKAQNSADDVGAQVFALTGRGQRGE